MLIGKEPKRAAFLLPGYSWVNPVACFEDSDLYCPEATLEHNWGLGFRVSG